MNIVEFLSGAFKLKPNFDKIDLGILNVAFMVAALDGVITDEEYEAFDRIARECRGYTPENAEKALREAMRSAGYLMLLGRRVGDPSFVKAFLDEAIAALPETFPFYEFEDVKWAFDMWMSVARSDNDYSPRERLCIEALKNYITTIRKNEVAWLTYSSGIRI